MSDNYAVINGKRVELTDEQVKALGIEKKNPFERVERYAKCYCINSSNIVESSLDTHAVVDNNRYEAANYFNDKDFANQVALHQLLYRKLLKFAYDNDCEDTAKWDCENRHWCIQYDHCDKVFCVTWFDTFHYSEVYFSTGKAAERAIREVIEPFMKEHPDFVW